jgi:hypothetical protein
MTRMRAFAIAGVCLVLANPAFADTDTPQPESPATSTTTYAALIEKAESGVGDIDYTALRLSYPQSSTYDPYGAVTRAAFNDAWNAFQKNDCDTALAKTDEIQKTNYTIVAIHAVRGECFERAGDSVRSARELAIAKGLAQSELASGDGKSPATAYHVVTMNEENFILTALGVTSTKQALLSQNGHSYDLMSGTYTKTGEPAGVLFLVDDIIAGELRILKNRSAN